nr:nucleotide-binding alpha-beta plait domain-containing protein [Tanacetum cinerariifolium]
SFSAKELFQSCKQYGHVVDTFISNKRSKSGRRFGFVRFINVFNEERLVNNLCTVWIDRFKLHANIARFHRTPLNEKKSMPKKAGGVKKDTRVNEVDNVSIGSWFSQLKQASMEFNTEGRIAWVEVEGIPFKLCLDNRFKRIATKWGELLDIDDQDEMCFHSKRLCIYTKSEMNIFEEFKIIFRDRDFWIRAKEAPGWVPDFMEENDDGGFNVHESSSCGGDSDVEGVLETIYGESGHKENNLDEKHTNKQENHSGDPFSVYKLLKKKKDNVEKENNSEHSMKYPPGFTPKEGTDVVGMHTKESDNVVNMSDHNAEEVNNTFSGGSFLSLMDKLVKVGQVMGYKMDGCMSNMTEITESQGVKEVNQ